MNNKKPPLIVTGSDKPQSAHLAIKLHGNSAKKALQNLMESGDYTTFPFMEIMKLLVIAYGEDNGWKFRNK